MRLSVIYLLIAVAACSSESNYQSIDKKLSENQQLLEKEAARLSQITTSGKCEAYKPIENRPLGQAGILKVTHCNKLKAHDGTIRSFTSFDILYSGISFSGCIVSLLHVPSGNWQPQSESWQGGFIEVREVQPSWFTERHCI